jgi:hypothetical protein
LIRRREKKKILNRINNYSYLKPSKIRLSPLPEEEDGLKISKYSYMPVLPTLFKIFRPVKIPPRKGQLEKTAVRLISSLTLYELLIVSKVLFFAVGKYGNL